MANVRHECLEFSLKWAKSNGDCYADYHELSRKVTSVVQRTYGLFSTENRNATRRYLTSIGVEAPDAWIEQGAELLDSDIERIQQHLRDSGSDLRVRRFRPILETPSTLCEALQFELWSIRESIASAKWCDEVARTFRYEYGNREPFKTVSTELQAVALEIEIAADAIDTLQAEDNRPFDRAASQSLAAEMLELLHPDTGWQLSIAPLLRAYEMWVNEWHRLLNWLIYKDQSIKSQIDPAELALLGKPRLLARYRLLKSKNHAVLFDSVREDDSLWNNDYDDRTPEYMRRGFKELQTFLTRMKFDHIELRLTQTSARLSTF